MEVLSKRLMNWASILEPNTREQAERTSVMPFIYPHLALMPDAHLGRGATVGSVIPTLGAIMPAAVGVDIGCFHGDTRVPLLNGRQRSLKDLAEGEGPYWVYSLDADGRIVPGHAVALKTRADAELMRVTVSGGDEIVCTPDHPFMMNDGSYREARELRFNDSLMPLYRRWQTRDGYENVSTGKGGSRETHVLVYESLSAVAGNGRRGAPVVAQYNVSPRACGECERTAANPAALRWHKSREHGHDHMVIAVEYLTERADVYCLQVEEHHNFALAAGVFVHNCGMMAVRTQFNSDDARRRGDLRQLRTAIERTIPLSAGKHNSAVRDEHTEVSIAVLEAQDGADSAERIAPKWRLQLGSLGSGNHFIEVSLDEGDRIWLFLHSGSRGVGNKLAMKHIKTAQEQCRRLGISLPDRDLAYLVEDEPEFWDYIRDLRWAQHFALLNRAEMMHRVEQCFSEWIGTAIDERREVVNCHHNYTVQDTYCATCTGIQGSDSRLRERLLADETVAAVRDSLGGYRPSVHSCGGLLLTGAAGDPAPSPSRADVLARTGIGLVAQALGLEPAHSRSASYDLCECADLSRTDAASNTFLSKFGQDFCRPYAAETDVRRLDKVLAHIFFGVVPPIRCTSGHKPTKVWLSRKGAIDASEGRPGLIPGSMGTRSYVVEGKGNRLALNSSPHGAGREYSRTAARKKFTRAELDAAMEGIEWRRTDAFLDEIPGAYKDVEVVMADAADLVEVKHTLRQILNVKGD